MDLTNEIFDPITRPRWMPAPPIPQKEDNIMRRYQSIHVDRPDATVEVNDVPTGPVLRVTQTTEAGVDETFLVFFTTQDVDAQLDLASALEDIAETLRDKASAQFATFMAEQRREDQLHDLIEAINDASGFDSGYAA